MSAQFHRRRAIQHRQSGLAEAFLTFQAFFIGDLRCVFAGFDAHQICRHVPVEVGEERVDAPALAGLARGNGFGS